jgi:hypothetical protein
MGEAILGPGGGAAVAIVVIVGVPDQIAGRQPRGDSSPRVVRRARPAVDTSLKD